MDQVKAVAEQVSRTQNMVYEETSGLYYDYATGYYYDAQRCLYYDGHKGAWYRYNQEKQEYEVFSQVDRAHGQEEGKESGKRSKGAKKAEKKAKEQSDKEAEDGEVGDESDSEASEESEEASEEEEDADQIETEISSKPKIPPCIRAVITKSKDPKTLPLGSLFLVTISGGTVGREGGHEILLQDEDGVSKNHARISFEEDKYYLCDLGSVNGTFVNGERLSKPKQKSDRREIGHGSNLRRVESKHEIGS